MREDSEMLSNLPEALEVYKAVWLILTKTETSIEEIDAQETGLGLIGAGKRCLTRLLETLFGWSSTLRLEVIEKARSLRRGGGGTLKNEQKRTG